MIVALGCLVIVALACLSKNNTKLTLLIYSPVCSSLTFRVPLHYALLVKPIPRLYTETMDRAAKQFMGPVCT